MGVQVSYKSSNVQGNNIKKDKIHKTTIGDPRHNTPKLQFFRLYILAHHFFDNHVKEGSHLPVLPKIPSLSQYTLINKLRLTSFFPSLFLPSLEKVSRTLKLILFYNAKQNSDLATYFAKTNRVFPLLLQIAVKFFALHCPPSLFFGC